MIRGVIFDLFGTLVPNLDPVVHERMLLSLARMFGAPEEAFLKIWIGGFVQRMDGSLDDGPDTFLPALTELGIDASRELRVEADRIRQATIRAALEPKPDAIETLDRLQARNLRLGLATDCSAQTPDLLDQTPLGRYFPVRACSALLRVRKPHPTMYQHVLQGLDLQGSECLYVGDGNSEELPGARLHGMTTAWVDNGTAQHFKDRFVPEADHTVKELREIPGLL